jgi:hypothetical protein
VAPVVRTYRPDERPDVEVLVTASGVVVSSGRGVLTPSANGRVRWRGDAQAGSTFINTFPADRIRPDENVPART